MKIYVGNLPYEVTEDELQESFKRFGEVTSVSVIKDKYSGQSKGFGFVEMSSNTEAQAAIEDLNGKELKGRPLNVNEARPRTDAPRSNGGFGGGRGGPGGGGRSGGFSREGGRPSRGSSAGRSNGRF